MLAEHLEQKLCTCRRERHIAKLVDEEKLRGLQFALELEEALLVSGLHQLVDQRGGGHKRDGAWSCAFLRCSELRDIFIRAGGPLRLARSRATGGGSHLTMGYGGRMPRSPFLESTKMPNAGG